MEKNSINKEGNKKPMEILELKKKFFNKIKTSVVGINSKMDEEIKNRIK